MKLGRIAMGAAVFASLGAGCSGVGATGGTLVVSVEAESTVLGGIPAASAQNGGEGFADGWSLAYERFYVSIGAVRVAASAGDAVTVPADAQGDRVFDLRASGPHVLFSADDVAAHRYDQVSFRSVPAGAATTFEDTIPSDDRAAMNGVSTWITATATRGTERIRIDWKFDRGFEYRDCEGPTDRPGLGTVVASGGTTSLRITIHGDHWYWQALGVEGSPTRFDAIAHADGNTLPYRGNGDGETTLDELGVVLLADIPATDGTYDPAGRPVTTLADFMRWTTGTNGHIDGDGVCASRSASVP